jgi:hypothetical protein
VAGLEIGRDVIDRRSAETCSGIDVRMLNGNGSVLATTGL